MTDSSFLTLARRILEDGRLTLRERLQRLVDVIPWALDHGGIVEVGVFLEEMTVTTAGFQETPWMLGAAIPLQSGHAGRFCIALTESTDGPDIDPFSSDERQLVGAFARTIAEAIEQGDAGREEITRRADSRQTAADTPLPELSADHAGSAPAIGYRLGAEYLHRLLSAVPSMAYRRLDDSRWTLEFASLGCRVVTGFDPHDLMGSGLLSYADLVRGHDRTRVQTRVRDATQRGQPFQVTYTIRRVDGTERVVLDLGWPTRPQGGADTVVEGLIVDLTEALHDVGSSAGPGG